MAIDQTRQSHTASSGLVRAPGSPGRSAGHAPRVLRAGGLAAALLVAKAFAVAGRDMAPGVLEVVALCWQDVAVALVFWVMDVLLGRPRWLWGPYTVLAIWIVINVPVVALLGSPLTIAMIRAAGTPLVDSIWPALTPVALAGMALVAAAAAVGPRLCAAAPRAIRIAVLPASLVLAIAGSMAQRTLDTAGLQRNAVTAIVATLAPRIGSAPSSADFRASPFGARRGEDLSHLSGLATGQNVLIVVLESTAAEYLKPYGAADDPTPTLTALAGNSMVFDSTYAVTPESIKGLYSLLCSSAPAFDVAAETLAGSGCASIVQRVSRAGYRTALFHSGRFAYLGMPAILNLQGFDVAEDAGSIGGHVESSFGVDEPATVDRILSWIDRAPVSQPFFVTYLPVAGHHPYQATRPGPFPAGTDLGAYMNAIYDGDRALGLLFDGLRRRGLDERTLVVVFGDHGEAFGQHPGNRAHSFFIYDENVRVPLIVHIPGRGSAPVATRVMRVASVLDIGPTILDLLGLSAPSSQEGSSLLDPTERMALFYADYGLGWLGLRDGCWKFMFELEARRSRLFDVCADPAETVDLSAEHADRIRAYRARVEAWSAARRAAVLGGRGGKEQ